MGVSRQKSILSGITGKIGPVTFATVRDIEVVKSTPKRPEKGSGSSEQLEQRALFTYANAFLNVLGNGLPKLGYQLPKKSRMSKYNMALSDIMNNVVTGKHPEFSVDLSKLRMSNPINEIDACWNGLCTPGKKSIHVSWELNPFPGKTTRLDDRAIVFFYDETSPYDSYKSLFEREIVQRNALHWNFDKMYKFVGHKVHCWIFFVSADGRRVSKTEYLGAVVALD